ncbi:hypothetical protein BX286_4659 [Streptomyces sp. 3211.6]|uniref:hypothetical protein n=1 Tax=Streptomyces sp. 3211.6 TaxID=1938845 RepID=UPI000EB2ACAD|nr:hypothetical protein [Streptomyces sp. 3211.6]RKT06614.1 hypothetical protein BX286_4659 [Streptomyces sp. 3211.6]
MSDHTPRRRRRPLFAALAGALALTAGAGLLLRSDTDVLGQDRFCKGALDSAEARAALAGPGRLEQGHGYDARDPYYSFSCTVQRADGLLGAGRPRMTAELSFDEADFAFSGSPLWKNASAGSYFVGGATGAASGTQAWVLLPSGCTYELRPGLRHSQVPVLKLAMTRGRGEPVALAKVAMSAARHVAEGLGCQDTGMLNTPARLQGPVDADDPANTCEVPGFRLPQAALLPGKAEQGPSRVTGRGSRTRACEVQLRGPGEPRITLTVSDDPVLARGVRRDTTATADNRRTVVACPSGDLYVGMSHNDAYGELLLDKGVDASGRALSAIFDAFYQAVLRDRGCRTG